MPVPKTGALPLGYTPKSMLGTLPARLITSSIKMCNMSKHVPALFFGYSLARVLPLRWLKTDFQTRPTIRHISIYLTIFTDPANFKPMTRISIVIFKQM